eukprot:2705778-Prymnesium_polylepis.1
MSAAAQQALAAEQHLASLDTALASGSSAFDELSLNGGAIYYPGGSVERELEELCEAVDLFLDLASGRPLMTARLAPLGPSPSRLRAVAPTARAPPPRLCAPPPPPRLFEEDFNLIYDSKCA